MFQCPIGNRNHQNRNHSSLNIVMIHITNFDSVFAGRKFKDKTLGTQSDLICVGFGGTESAQFFVGSYDDANGNTHFKTVLMKNTEFLNS